MLELVLFVVATIAAGYALRKAGLVQAGAARDLNAIVFNLTLPLLVFTSLHRAELSWSVLIMPAVAWGAVLVGLAIGWGLARALKLPNETAGAWMLAVAFGNITFVGYPIVQGFYGAQHLTLAIFYDQLGATLATNTIGIWLASRLGHGEAHLGAFLKRFLRFPTLWALVAGLLLHSVPLPETLAHVLTQLAALTVPLIMLSIGFSLQFRLWREDLPLVLAATALRLAVIPALVWGATRMLQLPSAFVQTAVLEAAMPTMFFALTVAIQFQLRVNLVVNAIMISTVLSFATLPLWHALLR